MTSTLSSTDPLAVSIIIVAADSGPTLREGVRHVLACKVPLELILVDNGSSDGIPQAIQRAHQNDHRLRCLYNHANLGFGPAVNRGAALAHSDVLLILNPDCMLDEASLRRLLQLLEETPKAGLIGAVVCDEQGVPDPASYRRDPLLRRALRSMFGGDKSGEGVHIAGGMPDHPVQAEAVSGALMVMPRRVFEFLRGFDEAYFLHCEDLDLCRRARDAGYQVWLAGDVRVLHGKGGSSRHRPVFVSWHKHRGMWRWFRKFDPASRHLFVRIFVWSGIWAHFVLNLPRLWLRLLRYKPRTDTA
ncbi:MULTISPECIES: glycosyltransferase family 2 protein [Dyella]|uniref:Glycosyltransferase family 2 protein n=2 Tax=Dyella TaxID=231454 RepID=A0A4R0Z1J9_9GAMM|nr:MULTISPECIES: glycosyltransferase family 2 protein [Dyella]TBR40280.1 glycosyltransferase family 2 protein [Dyella terrae]TCI12140.1 glycosyltransferase family 2 protein [Dyella soli]